MQRIRGICIPVTMSWFAAMACSPVPEAEAPHSMPPALETQARRALTAEPAAGDLVSGTFQGTTFPLAGRYTAGASDPVVVPNFEGYRVACLSTINISSEADAIDLCPTRCTEEAADSVWTGYYRSSKTTKSGVCECATLVQQAQPAQPAQASSNPAPSPQRAGFPFGLGGGRRGGGRAASPLSATSSAAAGNRSSSGVNATSVSNSTSIKATASTPKASATATSR